MFSGQIWRLQWVIIKKWWEVQKTSWLAYDTIDRNRVNFDVGLHNQRQLLWVKKSWFDAEFEAFPPCSVCSRKTSLLIPFSLAKSCIQSFTDIGK